MSIDYKEARRVLDLPVGEKLDEEFMRYVLKWKYEEKIQGFIIPYDDVPKVGSTWFSTDAACITYVAELLSRPWYVEIYSIMPFRATGSKVRWGVKLFDGEPIVCNGVGDVQGYKEYVGKGETIQEALVRAALMAHFEITPYMWMCREKSSDSLI